MTVPTFVGVQSGRNGSPQGTGSLTLDVPAGASGDLLVAIVGVKLNPSTTTPAGWTPIIAGFNGCTTASESGTGIRGQLSTWWKVSDGSETSVTVSFGAGVIRQASGAVLRYSGVDTTNPIDVSSCDKGTSSAPAAPSVTTTTADDRILRVVVADAEQAKSLFTSEPAAARFNIASTSVFGPGSSYTTDAVVTGGADEGQAAAGPTGTAAWALPIAEQWAAQTVAIRPAANQTDPDPVPNGCLAVILEILRKIFEAIRKALAALARWLKGLRNRRSGN